MAARESMPLCLNPTLLLLSWAISSMLYNLSDAGLPHLSIRDGAHIDLTFIHPSHTSCGPTKFQTLKLLLSDALFKLAWN